ncbi:tigger transposable element-derived protein 1-like [Macrobrachium nipponense]|uniref:tigger transposable element-derived protein 1-like n=1 Tax=Macrobrachium nipponense TaxID=159736 RepID=UPI0030C7DD9F
MPRRTFITAEEKPLPGHKPMNDHLTFLFCANASGDCKIKPLLVYRSENPRAFKKNKVQRKQLNMMWRSNNKAWVTRILFVEWINEVFGPEVKRYLLEKNLPLQALLLMDNAPAHPLATEDDLLEEFKFIKIKFLPPNTAPILTHGSAAWEGVTKRTLNSEAKQLWPDSVPERDFEGFEPIQEAVDDEIVSLGKSIGLEVGKDDINDLLDEHSEQLTTEELYKEQQKEVMEDISSEEEEGQIRKPIASSEIREMLKQWENVQNFIEKHHPDKALVVRAANLFTDNADPFP